jgi:hypothetical protein
MSSLAELLPHASTGVLLSDLNEAERQFGVALPDDLREFLLVSDGSPWVDFPECGFQMLSLNDMLAVWSSSATDRSGPPHLIDVASDGSRERFCVDPPSSGIVFLNITAEEPPVQCASTVTELVQKLADGWDPFSLLDDA